MTFIVSHVVNLLDQWLVLEQVLWAELPILVPAAWTSVATAERHQATKTLFPGSD
jgi:hypothetical protein